MTQYVYGKNVVKQLLTSDTKVYELILANGLKANDVEKLANKAKIKISKMDRKKMDSLVDGNHQGMIAKIDDYKIYEIDELLASIPEGKQPLLVMLDELQDPHNLGAILRTCDCVGADGVIICKHSSVKLNATVAKVSTGAINTVKVSMVTNLSKTIQYLKEKGYWVCGADFENSCDYRSMNYDMPLVLVIGAEGFGISPLVRKNCDFTVRLPMEGTISSLNASVACSVLLYAIYDKRHPLTSK